ncbi:MAG: kelch repeat-containing protein [Terricaulis sp.]
MINPLLRIFRCLPVVGLFFLFASVACAQSNFEHPGLTHQGFAAVLQDDTVFVIGGLISYEGNTRPVTDNYKINLGTRSVTRISTDVIFSNSNAAAFWDGRIYVSGGSALVSHQLNAYSQAYSTGFSRAFAVYDIANDSWERLPNMPTTAYGHCSFASGGNVYVVGGQQQRSPRPFMSPYVTATRLLRYSIADRRWTWMDAPAGILTQFAACTQLGNEYFVIGGHDGRSLSNTVWAWNFEANTWRRAPDLPHAMSGAKATTYDDAIYVAGGSSPADANGQSSGADHPVLVLRNGAEQWEVVGQASAQRFGHAIAAWNDGVFLIGGNAIGSPRPSGLWIERIR